MSNKRIDKGKVARGGATKREFPSRGGTIIFQEKLAIGRVLDYGCGYGLDAKTFGWESYDPYYNPVTLVGEFDTIICTNVLNAVSKSVRSEILESMQKLVKPDGNIYVVAPRNIPVTGKYSGYNRRPQYYVLLTGQNVSSVYKDTDLEIYQIRRDSDVIDKTSDVIVL